MRKKLTILKERVSATPIASSIALALKKQDKQNPMRSFSKYFIYLVDCAYFISFDPDIIKIIPLYSCKLPNKNYTFTIFKKNF